MNKTMVARVVLVVSVAVLLFSFYDCERQWVRHQFLGMPYAMIPSIVGTFVYNYSQVSTSGRARL